MGIVSTIGKGKFPKQGGNLNQHVKVCYNYDVNQIDLGRILRNDIEEPFRTIIMLSDGRLILADECQYSLLPEKELPIKKLSDDGLIAEWTKWKEKIEAATSWGAAIAAANEFRQDCEREINRRNLSVKGYNA